MVEVSAARRCMVARGGRGGEGGLRLLSKDLLVMTIREARGVDMGYDYSHRSTVGGVSTSLCVSVCHGKASHLRAEERSATVRDTVV